ncbi:MAG: DUF4835 family protein [Paludibacteraceae bacterium]|nr:DUF4835 family protein [Paludibacteraceae bacterium]
MRRCIILTLLAIFCLVAKAQELNCRVSINHQQIQGTNTQVFQTLETAIREFMNNRRWTRLNVLPQERIECSLLIVVNQVNDGVFNCEATVQSLRPVYNTTYTSPLINRRDKNFSFTYSEFDQLEYQDNYFESNLTAMLSYYAYMILGYDADSYSRLGGTPYFRKCEDIVSAAQGASLSAEEAAGWRAFESNTNRYTLANNLNDDAFRAFRNYIYEYHRLGLDAMQANTDNGRAQIADGIGVIREAYRARPSAGLVPVFLDAKNQELVDIFKQGTATEKKAVYDVLMDVDPTRNNEYEKIL